MNYLTKQLKADIQAGGIIIAPAQAGKTTAEIELLREDRSFVLVCHCKAAAENLAVQYPDVQVQIIRPTFTEFSKLFECGAKFVLDEAQQNPLFYNRDFDYHAAVLTPTKRIVMYNQAGMKVELGHADTWTGGVFGDMKLDASMYYVFVCPRCRETRGKMDVIGLKTCKICKSDVYPVQLYPEHLE